MRGSPQAPRPATRPRSQRSGHVGWPPSGSHKPRPQPQRSPLPDARRHRGLGLFRHLRASTRCRDGPVPCLPAQAWGRTESEAGGRGKDQQRGSLDFSVVHVFPAHHSSRNHHFRAGKARETRAGTPVGAAEGNRALRSRSPICAPQGPQPSVEGPVSALPPSHPSCSCPRPHPQTCLPAYFCQEN